MMRFFNDWRAGKTTIKEVIHRRDEKDQTPPKNEQDVEKRFLDKVEAELQLPEYSLFSEELPLSVLSMPSSDTPSQPTTRRWSPNLATSRYGAMSGR